MEKVDEFDAMLASPAGSSPAPFTPAQEEASFMALMNAQMPGKAG